MGDSISEGTVETYLKCKLSTAHPVAEPGDFVEVDETIASIETDKVIVDIKASHAGVIMKYFAAEGDRVEVDAEFVEIDTDAKAGSAPKAAAPPKVGDTGI